MVNLNLRQELIELGLPHDDKTLECFDLYMKGILSWNTKVNLTAILGEDEFIEKHYIDSLQISQLGVIKSGSKVIDIGTGGGFPGIPLAIIYPESNFVLADSLNKRLKIIKELVGDLSIKNVEVLHGRAEDIGQNAEHREQYDCCVSRAVANLSTLCEYCLPTVKLGGTFIAYKSGNIEDEIKTASKAIHILGGGNIDTFHVGGNNNTHCLVKIEKIKSTPKKYPRKAGTPSKQPL